MGLANSLANRQKCLMGKSLEHKCTKQFVIRKIDTWLILEKHYTHNAFFLGFPGRPPAPSVSSISTTSISIQWDAPDEVGDGITGYHVRWQEEGASIPKQKVVTSSTVVTLNKLTPYTWYTIQVQAKNNKGVGLWSEELKLRSNESGNYKCVNCNNLYMHSYSYKVKINQRTCEF